MSNSIIYEIEGGVDFFKALKQFGPAPSDKSSAAAASEPTLDPVPASASAISLSVEEPRCLITDEKLRKDHIKLKCGHRFNYVALFKEVLFQKCALLPKNLSAKIITTYTKPNVISSAAASSATTTTTTTTTTLPTNQATNVTSILYNSSYNLETTKLNYNEIKCPYCRTITPYILPYYPYPDVCKVKYVNVPANLALPSVSCEYGGAGGATQTSNADAGDNDKNSCRASCMYNEKYDMILCSKHLNKLETNGNKVSRQKRSQTNDKSSTNETPSSNVCDENVIISHHNPATTGCSFILLSGARKGCPCKKPLWSPKTSGTLDTGLPAFCKAHYDKGVGITHNI